MRAHPFPATRRSRAWGMSCLLLASAASAPAADAAEKEALQARKMVEAMIHGRGAQEIPLKLLPKELKFEPGKLSLIPDPSDASDGRIAIYLTNATGQAVAGADSHYAHCFLEVKDGHRWRACERFALGCGTGIPDPKTLPSNHATIFLGTDPNRGDMTGELRFCLTLPDARPVVSPSFHGRFSSKKFEEAAPPASPLSAAILDGLGLMAIGKAGDGSPHRIARSPEEFIAAAELERCYDESAATRSALIRWQASLSSHEDTAPCRRALEALLKRPWGRRLDAPALFERSITALTRRDGGDREFGSPERCRAMVWRYLGEFRSSWLEILINPERWDQLEAIRQSGNPWGVDQKRVVHLLDEAIASLRSPDADEREAAGSFLAGGWITQAHLSDERCGFVLEHEVASERHAAISLLNRRGKGPEAGRWLADHRGRPGLMLSSLWRAASDQSREFAAWEMPVALQVLESSPLQAAEVLASRRAVLTDAGGKRLPVELREPLRRFLVEEAKAKRLVGPVPPHPVGTSSAAPGAHDPHRDEPNQLRSALQVLADWNDPRDTAVLKSFLVHPAASYSTSGQKIMRHFGVRSAAVDLLEARKEGVPSGTVLEEPAH